MRWQKRNSLNQSGVSVFFHEETTMITSILQFGQDTEHEKHLKCCGWSAHMCSVFYFFIGAYSIDKTHESTKGILVLMLLVRHKLNCKCLLFAPCFRSYRWCFNTRPSVEEEPKPKELHWGGGPRGQHWGALHHSAHSKWCTVYPERIRMKHETYEATFCIICPKTHVWLETRHDFYRETHRDETRTEDTWRDAKQYSIMQNCKETKI